MKQILSYSTALVKMEVLKIFNGYILQFTGIGKDNSNYKDATYFSKPNDVWESYKNWINMLTGTINYNFDDVEW